MTQVLEYNSIIENDQWFFLMKRTDTKPILQFPFKDIWVQVGSDGSGMFLHSLAYPKSQYTKEMIEEVAQKTKECPLCRHGLTIVEIEGEGFKSYVREVEGRRKKEMSSPNFEQALKKLQEDFSAPKPITGNFNIDFELSEFLQEGSGALAAIVSGLLIDNSTSEMFTGRVLKGLVGAAALGLSFAPRGDKGIPMTKGAFKMARTLGWASLVSALDPRPEDVQRMQMEAERLKSEFQRAMNMGPADVLNVIKDRFKMPTLSLPSLGSSSLNLPPPEIRDLPAKIGKEEKVKTGTTERLVTYR